MRGSALKRTNRARRFSCVAVTVGVCAVWPSMAEAAKVAAVRPAHADTVWEWIGEALPAFANALAIAGLGLLVVAVVLVPVARFVRYLLRRHGLGGSWIKRWLLTPKVQIQAFNDSAMTSKLGAALAALAQARVGGGREGGVHLYLVTGEQPAGDALAALQGVAETRMLAVALSVLASTWGKPRLLVSGSLLPVGDTGDAALTMSLQRNSRSIAEGDFWPSEPPTVKMMAADSNRVLAVAAAGWIEHHVVEQTPGPRARDVFYSSDARSWALFRAGTELQRMSALTDAANAYEQALALDESNIGALVDLAHLRRRQGYFRGATELATRAVNLIEDRDKERGRPTGEDPDWFRANIVLATVHATRARAPQWDDNPPRLSAEAYKLGLKIAREAMKPADQPADQTADQPGDQPPDQPADQAYEARRPRSRRERLRHRMRDLVDRPPATSGRPEPELKELLETTFEPAALLLVASNRPLGAVPAMAGTGAVSEQPAGQMRVAPVKTLQRRRDDVRELLVEPPRGGLPPQPLIDYIEALPVVSPRVEYNLACFHSRLAEGESDAHRCSQQLDVAFNYLRRSLSRTPPLERSGLLDYAYDDEDLQALRRKRFQDMQRLEDLLPPGATTRFHQKPKRSKLKPGSLCRSLLPARLGRS